MFYILMKHNLSACSFMNHAVNITSKKSLPNSKSKKIPSIFSLRRFMILDFSFRSKTRFELIFVYGASYRSKFNLWAMGIQHHLLKRPPFPLFCTFVKNQFCSLILNSLICSINLFVIHVLNIILQLVF